MFQILNHIENARRRNCATNQNKKKISEISIMRKINEETSIKNAKSWRKDKRM